MMCTIDGKKYKLIEIKRETFGDDVITIYKCPLCGEGTARRIDENTPGCRDHSFYIDCKKCNPGHHVITTDYTSSDIMCLKTNTLAEIAKDAIEVRRMKERWD